MQNVFGPQVDWDLWGPEACHGRLKKPVAARSVEGCFCLRIHGAGGINSEVICLGGLTYVMAEFFAFDLSGGF